MVGTEFMKTMLLFLISAMPLAGGVVELFPVPPVAVFGGGRRAIDIAFRNPTQTNVLLPVEFQVLQTSSTTAAPWSEPSPWRSLTLAPRQTIVEHAEFVFPAVRGQSQFIVRFSSGRDVLGLLPVRVYPQNILGDLADSVGPVVVSSLQPELRRALGDAGFILTELVATQTHSSRHQLSIHGPEFSDNSLALVIGEAVSRAKSGSGVVLILSDYDEGRLTAPSYYPVRVGQGTLVTVRADSLAHLATDPLAQLRLNRIIRLALGRESLNPPEPDL
jgi:hypothetical protein